MSILIRNGHVINPASHIEGIYDIYIEGGLVVQIDTHIDKVADTYIDANENWVVPGLIDLHVHLREPGFEHKETIASGTKSAVRGGFTTVCAMPNTKPATDSVETVNYILKKAKEEGVAHVLPIGAITQGQLGETLTDIKSLKNAGICGISEDGRSVLNAKKLREAMIKAKANQLPVFSHCEDDDLAGKGCMNEGEQSRRLGLEGIPNEAEDVIAARDIILARETGAKLHLCHVSTKGSVELIEFAKSKVQNITAEVCPHHFTLTDSAVDGVNTNTKMNPPLRSQTDVEALKNALKNDIIDCIATDHAPHHEKDKNVSYSQAPNGIVGLETAVALTITELVKTGYLTPKQFVEKLSYNPAKILGIDKGNIEPGKMADITIIDPHASYAIDIDKFETLGRNTPFDKKQVKGLVLYTIVNGTVQYAYES